MKKETPAAQAHIDILHLRMSEIERHAREIATIGRITEEQHTRIKEALNNLGKTIDDVLHGR